MTIDQPTSAVPRAARPLGSGHTCYGRCDLIHLIEE